MRGIQEDGLDHLLSELREVGQQGLDAGAVVSPESLGLDVAGVGQRQDRGMAGLFVGSVEDEDTIVAAKSPVETLDLDADTLQVLGKGLGSGR